MYAATHLWGPKSVEKGPRFGHPTTGVSEGKVVGQSVLIQIWCGEKVLKRDLVFGVLLRRLAKGKWSGPGGGWARLWLVNLKPAVIRGRLGGIFPIVFRNLGG